MPGRRAGIRTGKRGGSLPIEPGPESKALLEESFRRHREQSDADRRPWDPLPDEPADAYEAFVLYLGLGAGRTLGRAAEEMRRWRPTWCKTTRQYSCVQRVMRLSATWDWVRRAQAFDEEVGQRRSQALEALYRQAAAEEARMVDTGLRVAAISLDRLARKIEEDPAYHLGPRDAREFARDFSTMLRLLRGLPTSISEMRGEDLRKRLLERLEALANRSVGEAAAAVPAEDAGAPRVPSVPAGEGGDGVAH